MSKKVAIVGFGASRVEAPFNKKSYEIWGMNDLYDTLPRWDMWFDLHDFDSRDPNSIATHVGKRTNIQKLAAYQDMKCPIVCQEEWPEIPNCIKYPLKEVQKKFCGAQKGYFTNQVSYMIAYAMYLGYKTIELYGVDMDIDEEYTMQRPSVEYWLGMARGMGIDVYVAKGSSLLKCPYLYAYEVEDKLSMIDVLKAKLKRVSDSKNEIQGVVNQNNNALNQYTAVEAFIKSQLKELGNV